MDKRRILSICLLAVLAVFCFAGCKKENAVTDEKLTITWMMGTGTATPEEGTFAEKLIEERFNVEITPIFAGGNYQEKKTMQIAGGEVPDVFTEADPSNLFADADQGALLELPYETIEKYAPTVYKLLNETEPAVWMYSYYDGANYGVPNLYYYNAYGRNGRIREDWLAKVGIDKVPETLDELHDALYKFTHDDPDGNGKNDTYGMTGDASTWDKMFDSIFGAYGVLPYDWMEAEDGSIVYGGFEQGALEAMTTLAAWYKEGLIHPDFITDKAMSTARDRFYNGQVGYLEYTAYVDPASAASVEAQTAALNPDAEVAVTVPVTGPQGARGTFSYGVPGQTVVLGAQLADEPEKVERILQILEAMASDEEFALALKHGQERVHWKYADDGSKDIVFIAPYDDSKQLLNQLHTTSFDTPKYFSVVNPSLEVVEKYTPSARREFLETYNSFEYGLNDAFFKPDILPSSAKYYENIRTKQMALITKVIIGEKTTEQYQAEFQEIWETYGGTELMAEAQEQKSKMEEVFKQVGVK